MELNQALVRRKPPRGLPRIEFVNSASLPTEVVRSPAERRPPRPPRRRWSSSSWYLLGSAALLVFAVASITILLRPVPPLPAVSEVALPAARSPSPLLVAALVTAPHAPAASAAPVAAQPATTPSALPLLSPIVSPPPARGASKAIPSSVAARRSGLCPAGVPDVVEHVCGLRFEQETAICQSRVGGTDPECLAAAAGQLSACCDYRL